MRPPAIVAAGKSQPNRFTAAVHVPERHPETMKRRDPAPSPSGVEGRGRGERCPAFNFLISASLLNHQLEINAIADRHGARNVRVFGIYRETFSPKAPFRNPADRIG